MILKFLIVNIFVILFLFICYLNIVQRLKLLQNDPYCFHPRGQSCSYDLSGLRDF